MAICTMYPGHACARKHTFLTNTETFANQSCCFGSALILLVDCCDLGHPLRTFFYETIDVGGLRSAWD